MSWYFNKGPENDIVISSRIRLARNLKSYPFPIRMNLEQSDKIVETIKDTILNDNSQLAKTFKYIDITSLNDIDKISLLEKHFASLDLIKNQFSSGILLNNKENTIIMVNEEDHLRIQSVLPGVQLNEAFELANKIDGLIEKKVEYACSDEIGYLTSCPTNLGTGMRASVMVHLPALKMIGYINGLLSTVSKLGLTVRGLYGEGSQATGDIYQISNQITLGQSEEDIISSVNSVVAQIVEQERMARNKLFKENNIQLEDKIFRSFGIFSNARLLTSNECMGLLSDIKLGICLGMINELKIEDINELMVLTQPASLQKTVGRILDETDRDIKRAEIVRKKLKKKEK